jgi:penicillin-binding protein 1A
MSVSRGRFGPLLPQRFNVAVVIIMALALITGACSYTSSQIQLDVPPSAESSRIFDADGRLITVLHGGENREVVPLGEIGENLQNAVIAIEDERFWTHQGVDPKAIVRAAKSNAVSGEFSQGGSTLAQQLIKNLTEEDEDTVERKLKEFSLSLQLERTWTKERILEAYLNTVFFCNNAWGVEAASKEYFGKHANELTNGEAALLAGILPAPCDFDPFDINFNNRDDQTLERRELVIKAMLRNGYLTEAEAAAASAEEIVLAEPTPDVEEQHPAPHFVDEVRDWFFANEAFGATRKERVKLFYEGGLEIHTTIDLDHQLEAELSVLATLGREPFTARGALVSLEPGTGRVRAMVGGLRYYEDADDPNDFAELASPQLLDWAGIDPAPAEPDPGAPLEENVVEPNGTVGEPVSECAVGNPGSLVNAPKFNLAMGSGRQVGSSFKPFVLAAALDAGYRPDSEFAAPNRITFEFPDGRDPWPVVNYGQRAVGGALATLGEAPLTELNASNPFVVTDYQPGAQPVVVPGQPAGTPVPTPTDPTTTLTDATASSSNTVFAQLMLEVGVDASVQMANDLGVTNEISPVLSAVLGSGEATVLDMASAYGTFAAQGVHVDPVLVEKVVASDGTLLHVAAPNTTRVLDTDVANQVTEILEQVVTRGTANRNVNLNEDRPAAGKTGTNQEWRDAWFVGYTPELATAVWVGFPRCQVSLVPPVVEARITGGGDPAKIWSDYMNLALRETEVQEFADPAPLPEVSTNVRVPRLLELRTSVALRRLEAAGLRVTVRDVVSQNRSAGIVISQFPRAGATVAPGAQVTLNVSSDAPAADLDPATPPAADEVTTTPGDGAPSDSAEEQPTNPQPRPGPAGAGNTGGATAAVPRVGPDPAG